MNSHKLNEKPVRVLHFVSGGFSGATQVAIDLVTAAINSRTVDPLLVLRLKRQTPRSRIDTLITQGLPIKVVSGLAHAISIWQLRNICKDFKPDILVAHGFSEHLIGRYAGLLAGVPTLIHVEHNSRERYNLWSLAQAKWLSKRTKHIIGVSDGVRNHLIDLGFPDGKIKSIPNGIKTDKFQDADAFPYRERACNIVMCARFSSQKDHETAIRALKILKQNGHTPNLILAGTGKKKYENRARSLALDLDLSSQVVFLGHCTDVPALLMKNQIFLLSTHYEGMPLALIEGMAAGCAVVSSDVIGVREVISNGENGLLTPEADPKHLAAALEKIITTPEFGRKLANQGRHDATHKHDIQLMRKRYEQLFCA